MDQSMNSHESKRRNFYSLGTILLISVTSCFNFCFFRIKLVQSCKILSKIIKTTVTHIKDAEYFFKLLFQTMTVD